MATDDQSPAVSELDARIANLPSKAFILNTVVGVGAVLAVVTVLGPTLAHLLGLK